MQGDPRVDEVMTQIKPHLKEEDPVHHYNRTYEAILTWLQKQLGEQA